MEKRLTMILASLFLCVGMALAQTAVTGTVVSQEDGQPVVGATVRVEGSNAGTVTDVDGKFSVSAPADAHLTVTYIGMKEARVKAGRNLRIVLEGDDNALDELVVTGYGSARKLGTIAGSVATVNSDAISNRPVASVGDALQGQVAGLQVFTSSGEPSATQSMTIRGITSINASTEPLFILDGSEISSNTFISLNPNDIENITVLKDASSTAIYGSRAANGVVIITSKKGKFGEAPTVTVSAQYSISELAHDGMDMMNTDQWFKFQEMVTPAYANDPQFQGMKNYYKKYNIGTDWKKKYLGGSAPTFQVDASVRGGSQNTAYLVSFSHYDADGLFDDSSLRRETLRANLEANITPWLKVGTNSNLAYTKTLTTLWSSTPNSVYNKPYAAHLYLPTQPTRDILGLVDSNGNPTSVGASDIDWANSTFEGYGDVLNYYNMLGNLSPEYLSKMQPISQNRVRINENAYVNLNPIKGLNIRSAVGVDWNDRRYSSKMYNFVADGLGSINSTGSAQEIFSRSYRWTVTNTVEYKFDFLRDHHVSVLLGQESMTTKSEELNIYATGATDNRLMLLNFQPNVDQPSQGITEEVRNSWFGMLNYNYKDRYFLDASIRRDGSSLFAEDHRWGTFGAIAAMWNITNESFMQPTKSWLNDLQFKISYGSTGNSGIDPYQALGLVGTGGNYNGVPGTAIANAGNRDLTWEKVKTFNVGIVGRLFNRVEFDIQYYNKTTSDMLMEIPYSYTTGFSSGYGNVAEMRNQGIDFAIGVDIIKNKDWYWNVKVNGNYNKNEITELFQGNDSYTWDELLQLQVGHAFGEYYMVRWSHVDPADGQNVWLDKDGNYTKVYSASDRVFTGKHAQAPWSGGLSTTLAWKGLQLDIQFTGMFDRYMFNYDRYHMSDPSNASSINLTEDMLNMWMKPGDVTNIAAADSPRNFDTSYLENASFVRLKFLQLSYTLPEKWMKATHFIKGAKVFFTGRNLLTFTSYGGYDPEADATYTLGAYPNTRQYSFGAQITF